MPLLKIAMAVEFELEILDPCRRTAVKRCVDEGFEHIPDFTPAFADRLAKCPGMLRSENRRVGIVVDRAECRPPPEEHRESVGEQEADLHPQRGRPAFDWADVGL